MLLMGMWNGIAALKKIWQFFRKLNIELPKTQQYYSYIYTQEMKTCVCTKSVTNVHSSIIHSSQKNSNVHPVGEWIHKMGYIHWNEVLICATRYMKLKNITPSGRTQLQKNIHWMIPFIWNIQKRATSIKTGNRLMVAWGWGRKEVGSDSKWAQVFFVGWWF